MTESNLTNTEWKVRQSQVQRIKSEVWQQGRASTWRQIGVQQDKTMMWVVRPSNSLSQGTGTMNGTFQNRGMHAEKNKGKTYTREKAREIKSTVNIQSRRTKKEAEKRKKKLDEGIWGKIICFFPVRPRNFFIGLKLAQAKYTDNWRDSLGPRLFGSFMTATEVRDADVVYPSFSKIMPVCTGEGEMVESTSGKEVISTVWDFIR